LSKKDSQLVVIKQTNEQLSLEVDGLRSSNCNLSEVARLKQELVKAKEKIEEIKKQAEDELTAKEFLVRTL